MLILKQTLAQITYLLLFVAICNADIIDRVVAIVNNDVITLSEVNQEGKALLQRVAETVPPQDRAEAVRQVKEKVINKLIENTLMQQEAEKAKITVSDAEVDRAYNRIIEMNNLSPEEFTVQLAAMGLSNDQYRKDLKTQVLSSKLVNLEIRSKVIIPEDKIIDYYDTHYTERMEEGGYYLLQIGIGWDKTAPRGSGVDGSKENARIKAEHVRDLALKGGDFRQLAQNHSNLPSSADGGDIGILQGSDMSPAMFKVISQTGSGGISPIIETSSGFQFFKVLSSKKGEIVAKVPYISVKEEIYDILYKQEMETRYQQWLEQVKSKAYIKIL